MTLSQINTGQKIAVIGAGIVGVCCALYLQRKGYNVELIDPNGVAQQCSKGNAGHFATEQIFPLADKNLLPQLPKMLLDPSGPFKIRPTYLIKALPWFSRFVLNMRNGKFDAHKAALKLLNAAALDAYHPLLKAAGLQNMLLKHGSLLTFERTKRKQIQQQYEAFKAEGVNLQWLDNQQTLALEPKLCKQVSSSFYFEDVAHTIDPEQFCQRLAEYFFMRGGTLVKDQVELINPHVSGVELQQRRGCYNYAKVIIATGAWSKALLTPLKYKLPLDTERGYHLMLSNLDTLSRPVASAERKFIMTPMQSGLRLAGTVEFAGLDAPMDPRRADSLLAQAQKLLPDSGLSVGKDPIRWMGCRPSLPDSLPVLGEAPRHKHLYFAFGHQHLGLTQAAITGKLIAQQLAGESTSIDLSPFSISRFN
ncbi:NAD(P)/FAD-dependent oxidoreductase [Paraglaciecola arctica]|uniref:D-amino-acid dehydrogenase n=1 Tax=Paraglaciecola arctica BSs20135 TaxID=493475 RepID=K6Z603_9ALTE|nr:D-amino-acid dehydrogenase [Paraglaciecola arctica BSs20135]